MIEFYYYRLSFYSNKGEVVTDSLSRYFLKVEGCGFGETGVVGGFEWFAEDCAQDSACRQVAAFFRGVIAVF